LQKKLFEFSNVCCKVRPLIPLLIPISRLTALGHPDASTIISPSRFDIVFILSSVFISTPLFSASFAN
jgi:hypothetical protein